MEYRRINPPSSLPSPPSHTHTYTNSIPLDFWSISRDNTTPLVSLCIHRDALTILLGSLCVHRDAPSDNPPIKMPPSTFSPHPGFYVLCYTCYKRQHGSLCVCSPGAGFNPLEFLSPCGLSVSCCLATSRVWSRNSKRLVTPPRVYVCICMDSAGPAWSSLAQDLYGSGRHESGIGTSPSPRPWRARRLDSTVWTLVFG